MLVEALSCLGFLPPLAKGVGEADRGIGVSDEVQFNKEKERFDR